MLVAPTLGPERSHQRWVCIAATVACIVGAIASVVSFASVAWYTVSGPHVYHAMSQVRPADSGPVLIVSSNGGAEHAAFLWLGLGVTIAATVLSLVRSRFSVGLRVVAGTAALITGLAVVIDVLIPRFAVGAGALPPQTSIHVQVGFWVAIAGLVAAALGAIIGPHSVVLKLRQARV